MSASKRIVPAREQADAVVERPVLALALGYKFFRQKVPE
jgi:hypothetical protein